MIQRITMEGINIPKLYIAENNEDVAICKQSGIPYVRWKHGMQELIRQLLRPTLERMFPGIKWDDVLGKRRRFRTEVTIVSGSTMEATDVYAEHEYDNDAMVEAQLDYDKEGIDPYQVDDDDDVEHTEGADIAGSKREFSNESTNEPSFEKRMRIEDYVGDLSSCVNLEVLQKLNLMPKFIGDIIDCIKVNLSQSMHWTEGYNKKLGVPIGKFGGKHALPNLIILDVSGSIPRGISATMLTLIDTMRSQLDADLIITSDRSVYYERGTELPSPQTLRNYFGYGNEAYEFYSILEDKIMGKEWGHVISFGDNDCPQRFISDKRLSKRGTKIHAVHHYHTRQNMRTGYAEWCHEVATCSMQETYDTSWCKIMKKDWRD